MLLNSEIFPYWRSSAIAHCISSVMTYVSSSHVVVV